MYTMNESTLEFQCEVFHYSLITTLVVTHGPQLDAASSRLNHTVTNVIASLLTGYDK